MGPCLWGTEYSDLGERFLMSEMLQWGRAFGARNTVIWSLVKPQAEAASMGPCLWGTEYRHELALPSN